MSLEIASLLGLATWQSAPSIGRRRFGVPPGGPFDGESAALANALVANRSGMRVLELSNAVIELRATEPVVLACVGAPLEIAIDGLAVPSESRFVMTSGASVKLAASRGGARAYLAAPGGWMMTEIRVGATLRCAGGACPATTLRLAHGPRSLRRSLLRCVAGPQADLFKGDEWLRSLWTVSPAADRVGVRLTGPPLEAPGELPSEPACVGAVQVANDGQPIILGPDGPTIGGYAKIAVICSADLDKVAQLVPGERVSFSRITLEAALGLAVDARHDLDQRLRQIQLAAQAT